MSSALSDANAPCDPAPTRLLSDPHRDAHITLTRPNTVLHQATVGGGLACRGAFTGAMADEFRSADGKKEIYSMFVSASARVKQGAYHGAYQIPKLESTTDKHLILPPVKNFQQSNERK